MSDNATQHSDMSAVDDPHAAEAAEIVKKYMKWAAGLSLIPIPFVDLASVIGVQVKMLSRLAAVYGVPFYQDVGKSAVTSLVGGLSTGWLAGGTTASLAKFIPGAGMVVGVASLAGFAAATTFAIGRVFTMHFASGGTLLTLNTDKMRSFFQKEFEKAHAPEAKKAAPAPAPVASKIIAP